MLPCAIFVLPLWRVRCCQTEVVFCANLRVSYSWPLRIIEIPQRLQPHRGSSVHVLQNALQRQPHNLSNRQQSSFNHEDNAAIPAMSDNEVERAQILQDTLQQISTASAADGAPERECCVICLGDLTEPCQAQPCGHTNFDFVCLATWLETCANCPLCKSDVAEVGYDPGEDGKHRKAYTVPQSAPTKDQQPQQGPFVVRRVEGTVRRRVQEQLHRRRPRSPATREDEAIRRRRMVYRYGLYSLHVGSNRRQPPGMRYTELSPQRFATEPELVSRARMFIRRELRVFRFLYTYDDDDWREVENVVRVQRPCRAEFLLEYIVAILKAMDTQGSAGQAEELVSEFLGRDNARLFLHELRAWLRSPCKTLEDWDRLVQYNDPRVMYHPMQDRQRVRNETPRSDRPTPVQMASPMDTP